MDYYHLKSILGSGKRPVSPSAPCASFFVAAKSSRTYIEPMFQKIVFESEKPTILLISAVGATGKTTLAEQLSHDLGLPLFDLAKHQPVGANTLTGLLTQAFATQDLTNVFAGLAAGTLGVIIDGVDEGRSKTTERAFEAFLDDVAVRCTDTSPTTFVLLGRTQILDGCWEYLASKVSQTALATILPFDLSSARKYIDAFASKEAGAHLPEYVRARDLILAQLAGVFGSSETGHTDEFLSFIGYPPVLDAIVTLLAEEKNYHKLAKEFEAQSGPHVEVSLLNRIAHYVIEREREQKVIPNILSPIIASLSDADRASAVSRSFSAQEQCVRLVAHCVGVTPVIDPLLGPSALNERYEDGLAAWLPEHPFLKDRQFRSAVFEAMAVATLMVSQRSEHIELAMAYLRTHKHSYHFIYQLHTIAQSRPVPIQVVGALCAAAMEFRTQQSAVEIRIDGPEWNETEDGDRDRSDGDVAIEIEVLMGEGERSAHPFEFHAAVADDSNIELGPRLGATAVSVPCAVTLGGGDEIELTAPVEIIARHVGVQARELILRPSPRGKYSAAEIIVETGQLSSRLEVITTNGVPLVFALGEQQKLTYPIVQYARQVSKPPGDPLFQQKYMRLKRILMAFRSHSKGALARYRYKIEHERVLKNETGRAVLRKLMADGVLILRGDFYYLQTDELSARLGVSWHDLRKGSMPPSLEKYIKLIS